MKLANVQERDPNPAKWELSDIFALQALAAFAGPYVPWSAWSMRPSAVATIANLIVCREPATVVELGAGASSLYLARAVASYGGELVVIEQDATWSAQVRRLLDREDAGANAHLLHADLEPVEKPLRRGWPVAVPDVWYALPAIQERLTSTVDLLVVDGPAAGHESSTLVRYPAVPLLSHALADDAVVALDDIDRAAERRTLAEWASLLGRPSMAVDRSGLGLIADQDAFLTVQ